MTVFNCACEDTLPERKTLSEMRISLMRRLGFAAQVLNPPPGMNDLLTEFLNDAQEQLYRQYAALRTERIFSWQMPVGERYYGIGESDEVTVSVTPGGASLVAGYSQSIGSVDPDPWILGQTNQILELYTDTGDTTLTTSEVIDTDYWKTLRVYGSVDSVGYVDLDLTAPTSISSDGLTFTWASTPVWEAADRGTAVDVTFLGSCETLKLEPTKITWVGVTDQNEVWYPLIEGIPPELYTRVQLTPGWPTRYEIRSCIEVFPAPQAIYTLRIKGHFALQRFTEDTDKTTIDSHPVFLMALALAKTHYGKPDASSYFNQTMNYLNGLVAGSHATARYVPNPHTQVEALTPPRMIHFED